MLYLISLLLVTLGLIFKKSKLITAIIFLLLWILFGWSYGNADYEIHLRRYTKYVVLSGETEFLYTKLMQLSNGIGLDYQSFLILCSIIILICLVFFIKSYTKNVNFVLALYIIYPLCMDVTMVRYTLATALIIVGFKYLLSNNKLAIQKYIMFVLLASMIHISSIIFMIFIVCKLFDRKKIVRITVIICVILFTAVNSFFAFASKLSQINFLSIGEKINIILNASQTKYSSIMWFRYQGKIIIIFALYLMINIIILRWIYKNHVYEYKHITMNLNLIEIVLKMNIICMVILPLIMISADIFRVQLTLTVVNYVAIAQYYDIRSLQHRKAKVGRIPITNGIVTGITVLYSIVCLYLWVLSSSNIMTVFRVMFEKNLFFK